jgi:hypothetical protein
MSPTWAESSTARSRGGVGTGAAGRPGGAGEDDDAAERPGGAGADDDAAGRAAGEGAPGERGDGAGGDCEGEGGDGGSDGREARGVGAPVAERAVGSLAICSTSFLRRFAASRRRREAAQFRGSAPINWSDAHDAGRELATSRSLVVIQELVVVCHCTFDRCCRQAASRG